MKKSFLYLIITLGLSLILGLTSRFSPDFSEWYAVNVYPLWVGSLGRLFGLLPFSAGEVQVILLIVGALVGLVFTIIKAVKSKPVRMGVIVQPSQRKAILARAGMVTAMTLSTALLLYIANCGVNYNRHTFLHGIGPEDKFYVRDELAEWVVFLKLLDEFYTAFPDGFDDSGYDYTSQLRKDAVAAMNNLSKQEPKLRLHFPPPKPVMLSGLMSDSFIVGIYWPLTIEANYNAISPPSQRVTTALHELAHLGGFMRENEAHFISFLAARESDVPEFVYAAYVFAFDYYSPAYITPEMLAQLPQELQDNFRRFAHLAGVTEWKHVTFVGDCDEHSELLVWARDILPLRISETLAEQSAFWWSRHFVYEDVIDEDTGEVIDTIIVDEKPAAEWLSNITAVVNDTYLILQGVEDGAASYSRVSDLIYATYLREILLED